MDISNNLKLLKGIYFFKSLNFFAPILALFYLARNLTTFEILSLEVILTLTLLFAEVPTGIAADKIKRKYALSLVIFFYLVGNIITIYATNYYLFALVQIIFGIALAFGSGAIEALVYDTLKVEKRTKEMNKEWGSITSMFLFAGVFSALIGGFITKSQTIESFLLSFWLYSIGALIALVLSFFIVEPKHYKQIKTKNSLEMFKESVGFVLKNKSLRHIVFVSVFTIPFPHIIKLLFQPYFNLANVDSIFFGIAVSLAMVCGALIAKNAYRIEKKFGIKNTIFFVNIFPGIIYILMSFIIQPVFAFIFYVVIYSLSNIRAPLFSQYQNDHIKSHNRATVLSVISMFNSIYFIISQLLIGKIADYNLLYGFLSMGILIISFSLIFRIDENHIRN